MRLLKPKEARKAANLTSPIRGRRQGYPNSNPRLFEGDSKHEREGLVVHSRTVARFGISPTSIGPRAWTVPYLSYSTFVRSVLTANLAFADSANLLLHALIYTRRGNNDDSGRPLREEKRSMRNMLVSARTRRRATY